MAEFVAARMMETKKRPSRKLKPVAVPTIFSHSQPASAKQPRRESLYLKRKHDEEEKEVGQVVSSASLL